MRKSQVPPDPQKPKSQVTLSAEAVRKWNEVRVRAGFSELSRDEADRLASNFSGETQERLLKSLNS